MGQSCGFGADSRRYDALAIPQLIVVFQLVNPPHFSSFAGLTQTACVSQLTTPVAVVGEWLTLLGAVDAAGDKPRNSFRAKILAQPGGSEIY